MDNCSSNLLSQIHDDDTYYYYYYHVVRYSWVGSGGGITYQGQSEAV
jgi:hypothetical protein